MVDYNTVSEEMISRLINIIIDKITGGSIREHVWESMTAEYEPDNEEKLDMLFYNLFNKLKRENPACELIAYQPRIYFDGKHELKKRLKDDKRVLSKTAFISDDKQLIIMEREIPRRKNRKEEIQYSYSYLPYQSITGVSIENLDEEGLFCNLKFKTNGNDFNCIYERRNKRIRDICEKLAVL